MTHSEWYEHLRKAVDLRLSGVIPQAPPVTLYEPASYILSGSGKRIRPVLLMVSCAAAGGHAEDALHAAVAVEILHNFTLVHDDIMDNADQRRGRATVHTRWDQNVAILVGDALMGLAYREMLLLRHPESISILQAFTEGLVDVCEGQTLDKEFEALLSVSELDYANMIEKKTGRLVEMSADIGARIAGADEDTRKALVTYASHIGAAFQVRDDLLDVVANETDFGKAIGGDIIEGKKTYLLVQAMARAEGEHAEILHWCASRRAPRGSALVAQVTRVYRELGILDEASARVERETTAALHALTSLPATPARSMLEWFADMLLNRSV